jgi:hypothetical protein
MPHHAYTHTSAERIKQWNTIESYRARTHTHTKTYMYTRCRLRLACALYSRCNPNSPFFSAAAAGSPSLPSPVASLIFWRQRLYLMAQCLCMCVWTVYYYSVVARFFPSKSMVSRFDFLWRTNRFLPCFNSCILRISPHLLGLLNLSDWQFSIDFFRLIERIGWRTGRNKPEKDKTN